MADLLGAQGADRRRGEEDRRPREEGGSLRLDPLATHAADRHDLIRVHGARVNNLKDVSVEIPKRRLTVFLVAARSTLADTDETVSRAKELGGTVLMEPLDLPDIGRLAVLQDPAAPAFR